MSRNKDDDNSTKNQHHFKNLIKRWVSAGEGKMLSCPPLADQISLFSKILKIFLGFLQANVMFCIHTLLPPENFALSLKKV